MRERTVDPKELAILALPSAAAWEAWLETHGPTSPGVWLKIAKKGSGGSSPSYREALDAALCFGWIDGTKRAFDDAWWLQRFTPRRPRSVWSKNNRQRVEQLAAEARLRPPGLREVEAAKADGRWEAAYPPQSAATVPDELAACFEAHPEARQLFDRLDSRNRYAILYRVRAAKRPETRAKRARTFVEMLLRGETIYPRGSKTGPGSR
jgi:uncharacterized protein YdeI (YjbR/CyaY-like superfamily)